MACNCNEGKTYNIGMGCCVPVLAPIENYYTKSQVDELIEGIEVSGVTEEELDEKIASAKTEIENEIPTVPTNVSAFNNDVPYLTEHQSLSGYATEQWVEDKHYITGVDLSNYATLQDIPTVPTSNTAFTNDAGYLTQHQSLEGYATEEYVNSQISSQTADFVSGEELSSYTYDKSTIDLKIASGGTFEPSQYYNKTATDALLADKLDASAYTPTDLSNYYNKSEVDNIVNSAKSEVEGEIPSLSGYATEQWVLDKNYISGVDLSNYATKQEIPTVPTSNTAFTNDAGYLTENDLKGVVQPMQQDIVNLETAVSGKQETLSAGTNISISNNVISATDTTYSAGDGIQISGNTISTTTKFQCLTEQEWASVSGNPSTNTIYLIH